MRRGFKPSLRDVKIANNKADAFYARMAGKEPMAQSQIAPKRIIKNRTPDEDLESGVMREIVQVVHAHPNVIFALRANSGMVQNDSGAPVWFYRWIKNNEDMTLTDIWGLATFGLFAIEAKRRDWTFSATEREKQQAAFIGHILRSGGRANFCTSGAQAKALLD